MGLRSESQQARSQSVVLKVEGVASAPYAGDAMEQLFCASLFLHPLICTHFSMVESLMQELLRTTYNSQYAWSHIVPVCYFTQTCYVEVAHEYP